MIDSEARSANDYHPDDEDVLLFWQATARAEALLDALAANDPPTPELHALLGYLREVVLARINEQEQQLFPALHHAGTRHPDLECLHEDHLLLRDDIDDLAAAAYGLPDTDGVATVTRRLIVRLEEHLRREATVLATIPGGYQTTEPGWAQTAKWYPLTEGPQIDLDLLRPDQAEDAVLNRLTHLRPGEHIELRSSNDPHPIWYRLERRCPGSYIWCSNAAGLDAWTVSVTRRPAD